MQSMVLRFNFGDYISSLNKNPGEAMGQGMIKYILRENILKGLKREQLVELFQNIRPEDAAQLIDHVPLFHLTNSSFLQIFKTLAPESALKFLNNAPVWMKTYELIYNHIQTWTDAEAITNGVRIIRDIPTEDHKHLLHKLADIDTAWCQLEYLKSLKNLHSFIQTGDELLAVLRYLSSTGGCMDVVNWPARYECMRLLTQPLPPQLTLDNVIQVCETVPPEYIMPQLNTRWQDVVTSLNLYRRANIFLIRNTESSQSLYHALKDKLINWVQTYDDMAIVYSNTENTASRLDLRRQLEQHPLTQNLNSTDKLYQFVTSAPTYNRPTYLRIFSNLLPRLINTEAAFKLFYDVDKDQSYRYQLLRHPQLQHLQSLVDRKERADYESYFQYTDKIFESPDRDNRRSLGFGL